MRNNETRAVAAQFARCMLNQYLGAGVHRAGGFVEDQQLRAGEKRACNGDQLLLAGADVAAVVADLRFVAVGQRLHEPVNVGALGGCDDLVATGCRAAVGDILRNRPTE